MVYTRLRALVVVPALLFVGETLPVSVIAQDVASEALASIDHAAESAVFNANAFSTPAGLRFKLILFGSVTFLASESDTNVQLPESVNPSELAFTFTEIG